MRCYYIVEYVCFEDFDQGYWNFANIDDEGYYREMDTFLVYLMGA